MCVKRGHKRGTYKYIVNVNDGTTPLASSAVAAARSMGLQQLRSGSAPRPGVTY